MEMFETNPKSSTPALFDTQVSPVGVAPLRAPIKFSGIPHNPNPPTNSVALDGMSLTA